MDLFNIVGFLGAGLYLVSYALFNLRRIPANSVTYIGMNLAAAICMMISLTVNWNGPAFFIQVCWVVLSIFGLCNCYFSERKNHTQIDYLPE